MHQRYGDFVQMTLNFLCATIQSSGFGEKTKKPPILVNFLKTLIFHYITDHSSETTTPSELKFRVEVDFCHRVAH